MAARRLQIHPEALAELKSAVIWYLERSEAPAIRFVAELDEALDLVGKTPARWPRGNYGYAEIRLAALPICSHLSGEGNSCASAGSSPRTQAARILAQAPLTKFSRRG